MKKLLLMLSILLFAMPSMADCFKYKEGLDFLTGHLIPVKDTPAARAEFKKYTSKQLDRPLVAAIVLADLECTREFLNKGANPNMWFESMGLSMGRYEYYVGAYPLKNAINSDKPVSLEILRLLLEHGADMTLRDKKASRETYDTPYESALWKAVFRVAQNIYGYEGFYESNLPIKKLKLLLEYGKKNNFLEKSDEDLISLTIESATFKNLEFVKLLLQYDIKVTRNDIRLAKERQRIHEPEGRNPKLHYFRDQVKLLQDARRRQTGSDEVMTEMVEDIGAWFKSKNLVK